MTLNLRDVPRLSIRQCEPIAGAVFEAKKPLSNEEAAAHLHIKPGTGGTNYRIIAARKYGLVKRVGGLLQITELGSRIVDRPEPGDYERAIRNVPLFASVIDYFKSDPASITATDLDRAFASFGVPEERIERVRKVFVKSWSEHKEQLNPVTPEQEARGRTRAPTATPAETRSVPEVGRRPFVDHPIVAALLASAPPIGEKWPAAKRADWIGALEHTMRFIYHDG
jgi:hypothetical protein